MLASRGELRNAQRSERSSVTGEANVGDGVVIGRCERQFSWIG
jgi:hypothetical protein